MKVFDLVKVILDSAFERLPGRDDGERDAAVNAAFNTLSMAYQDLTDVSRSGPGYGSAVERFAYVYKYTTCHANIVADKIREVSEIRTLLSRPDWIDVACVGGGPGSDFLGVVKHMMSSNATAPLKCYLLDKEHAWGDTWANVDRSTDELEFRISTHAQPLDVTDPDTWEAQTRYLDADLFTFTYFISEVFRFRDDAAPYFKMLMETAKEGAIFLYIDNDHSSFTNYFDGLAADAGLTKLDGGEEKYWMDPGEEKSSLEPYLSRYQFPKLQTKIAWRAFQK